MKANIVETYGDTDIVWNKIYGEHTSKTPTTLIVFNQNERVMLVLLQAWV